MNKSYCKVCGTEIHPKRVALGYKDSCVNHSTTSKFTGMVVADHKSTTWLNVFRDPATAKHATRLVESRGK